MNILDRYIGRQVFVSALFSVLVILIILVLGNVFKEILRELAKRPDLSLWFVFKFILLVIPISLSLAIPFSFLTAILLVFGRLSADSEFVSMRMAGLSMGRICVPVWVLAVFFAGICAWMNLSVMPAAKAEMEGMKDTVINMVRRDPLLIFPDQQVLNDPQRLPDYRVYAKKEDGLLKRFQMVKLVNNEPEALAIAESAEVSVSLDSEEPEMLIKMQDVNLMVRAEEGDFLENSRIAFMEEAASGVSLEEFVKKDDELKPDNLGPLRLMELWNDESLESKVRASVRTELSARLAFSVSCITFGLIGVPLGVTAQRRETTAGFVLSLIIAVTYYTMLIVARMMQEDEDKLPHVLVWVPNVLFIALGAVMFWRLSRK